MFKVNFMQEKKNSNSKVTKLFPKNEEEITLFTFADFS